MLRGLGVKRFGLLTVLVWSLPHVGVATPAVVVELKRKWDPHNLFSNNYNSVPG